MDDVIKIAAWITTTIGVVIAIHYTHDPRCLCGFLIPLVLCILD